MFNFLKSSKDEVKTEVITVTEAVAEETPKTFTDIRPQWKELAGKKCLSSSDMAALHIYRAIIKGEGAEGAKSRLKKAFKPVTCPRKLGGGAHPWGGYQAALYGISYLSWRYDAETRKGANVRILTTAATWLNESELKTLLEIAEQLKKDPL